MALSAAAQAQGSTHDEPPPGSNRWLYARFTRLALGPTPAWEPWASDTGRVAAFRWLSPAVTAAVNSAFPWQDGDTPEFEARGLTTTVSAGGALHFRWLTVRAEPVAYFAQNAGFRLDGAFGYRDGMRPANIDLPQRFGDGPTARLSLRESFARVDAFGATIGFSNQRLFWGPGLRHALLLSGTSPGFPHLSVGTTAPLQTAAGRFHVQMLYGRLDQSRFAPPGDFHVRFASGIYASWAPPATPFEVGFARFYHRPWPGAFSAKDLGAPFGSLFHDAQVIDGKVADNQLASGFFRLRLDSARFEIFGEFGRNDRSVDLRDLIVEPEHNSAWLVGFARVFGLDQASRSFWSTRVELANGRIAAIEDLGRPQATFYEHSTLPQGHTSEGRILGSPLIERASGVEVAVDKWHPGGRVGMSVMVRQMPPSVAVATPSDRRRSQWDTGISVVRFAKSSEFNWRTGAVFDLDRFVGKTETNLYLTVGWRPRALAPGPQSP